MIYEEYEAIWSKIRKIEKELFDLINKRDELFDMTQPKSSKFDKEIVDGKNPINTIEQYVIQKEYMNEKINQLNQTLDDRYQILRRKRDELKLSLNIYDKIYYLRIVEKLSPKRMAYLIPCDISTLYKKIKNIVDKYPMLEDYLYDKKSFKKR
ncbi:MAG: hypothetical protein II625_06210 [Bacilli bacterium]|nr:hypothetical protein [Bacilli bacterium]